MIEIDGSFGEGGGQIVRTALALSLVTGKPFRVFNIRKGRKNPGLAAQHLTGVEAAAAVGSARVKGAGQGAEEFTFEPGQVSPGDYSFSVGTAGSTTLVLQTILPPLMIASAPSNIVLVGGTHALRAPPVDFIEKTFAPVLSLIGPALSVKLDRYGFFPAGGGKVRISVKPSGRKASLMMMERGAIKSVRARAVVSSLPEHIARREIETVSKKLPELSDRDAFVESVSNARGPGNFVSVEVACEHITEVFTAFGRRGLPAEKVADQVADEARIYLDSGAAVGMHLADQLLLPMALGGGGEFATMNPSGHTKTNMEIIRYFLAVDFSIEEIQPELYRISI